jgi:hypothetical protein
VHDAVVGTVSHDKPECTTMGADPFGNVCTLGGIVCNEPLRERRCEPTDYCVPDAFCAGRCRFGFNQNCVDEAVLSATHLECTIGLAPDPADQNQLNPCPVTATPEAIDVTNGFMRPCASNMPAALSRLNLPLAFGPALQFGTNSGTGTTDVVVMLEPTTGVGCRAEVTITGTVSRDAVGKEPEPVGIVRWQVPMVNGGATQMHVLLPLWVRFEQNCPAEGSVSCTLVPDGAAAGDAVFKCAQ